MPTRHWPLLVLLALAGCTTDDGGDDPIDAMRPDGPAVEADAGPEHDAGPDTDVPDAEPPDPDASVEPIPDAELLPVQIQNTLPIGQCVTSRRIYPALPDEAGHWALERLSPPDTPTVIHTVEYQVFGTDPDEGIFCRTALPHRAVVFVAPDDLPPALPSTASVYREYQLTLRESPLEGVELTLDPPIVLRDGDGLFVAVEMVADLEKETSLCIGACRGPGQAQAERSFWSNSATEPYPWEDLVVGFGVPDNYTIWAVGLSPR